MICASLARWFEFNYAPVGQPFWMGADWPNVFVILIVAPLTYLVSRSKEAATHALMRQHHAEALEQREAHALRAEQRHVELLARHTRLGASLADLHEKHDDLHSLLAPPPATKGQR